MSVSMSDTPLPTSSTSGLPQADAKTEPKVSREAPAAPSFKGQNAANVNFQSQANKGGPMFGSDQSPAGSTDALARHYNAPAKQSFLDHFKQWSSHWFTGHRPPTHPGCGNPPARPNPGWSNPPPRPNPGCSNPPPRPNPGWSNPPPRPDPTAGRPYPVAPGRPDPQYSLKSREELVQQLRDSYPAFLDPNNPGYISVDSILAMAQRGWSSNPAMRENIRLANALLRDPELIATLIRNSATGASGNLVDWNGVNSVLHGQNYFKYKTDKELAGEMIEHYKELKGWGFSLTVKDMRKLASQALTGDAAKDHLRQLAQEFLNRPEFIACVTSGGKVSLKALYSASH